MRGRGLMLVAGMRAGERRAEAAQQQQQAQQQAQAQAYQQGQQAAQAQAAATAPQKDTTAELMKLSDLHKAGALTDQEFEAAKKKILS
ncbi:MAG: SHOCT domain-containing protein [Candidatus Bathyarchaeia archaeon]